jgi:Mrp family chromosome partitioning ATPase
MGLKFLPAAFSLALLLAPALSPAQTPVPAPASTPDLAAAKTFVEQVYADYAKPDWAGRSHRQANFYTVPLYHAILLDQRFHLEDTPRLDGDPLCDFQDPGDPGKLALQSIAVTAASPTTARATVAFLLAEAPHTVTLTLVRTPDGWRIADVATKAVPSLYRASTTAKKP